MNPLENPIRLLIADDSAIVREGLMAILSLRQQIEVVGEAVNGQEAVTLFRTHQPDVVLMDVRMPVMDGLEATRAILTEFPDARIVIFTHTDDTADSRAGAKALVVKGASRDELLHAIRDACQSSASPLPALELQPIG